MQTDKPGSLSDKFGDFGAAPTDQLWDSIAASLDQNDRKKRGAFWWWFGGIAAGLILVFSVYQIGYHFGKREMQVAENTTVNQLDEPNQVDLTVNEITTTDTPSAFENADITRDKQAFNATDIPEPGPNTESDDLPDFTKEDKSPDDISLSDNSRQIQVKNREDNFTENQLGTSADERIETNVNTLPLAEIEKLAGLSEPSFDMESDRIEKRKPINKWEFGFSAGTLAGYEASHQKLTVVTSNPQSLADFESLDLNSVNGSGNPTWYYSTNEVDASVRRPLNVEFSIARILGRRWSLGSGIGLNYFRAENVYSSPSEMKTRSGFLSVSIPLIADFDFIKHRRFETSVGFGVVNEFPFRMSIETKSADPIAASALTKEFSRGYMGSVLLRTGFSYGLNEHLKIGLSPNVRYYFHQSLESEIPVLKRNLWGGASIGATWTF